MDLTQIHHIAIICSDKDTAMEFYRDKLGFRVIRENYRPEFVRPYVEKLKQISQTDTNRVVGIHCLGAIKATGAE